MKQKVFSFISTANLIDSNRGQNMHIKINLTGDVPLTKEAPNTTISKFHTSSQTLPLRTHTLPLLISIISQQIAITFIF